MAYFLCRLNPPRPTFAQDMSQAERAMMQTHVAYWMGHLQQGKVLLFGPVADPKGGWGVAVLAVQDEAEVRSLTGQDPAMLSGLPFSYDIYPMPRVIVPPSPQAPQA